MSEHTPTPWILDINDAPWIITQADIEDDVICEGTADTPNWRSDFAFIVLAANNHDRLTRENEVMRAALVQFVATCDTAPPTPLIIELGIACSVARSALKEPT